MEAGKGRSRKKRARRERRKGRAPKRSVELDQAAPSANASESNPRLAYFEQARDFTPYLAVETEHGRYVVSTDSRSMGRHLFSKGGRPEWAVLRRAMTVLDHLVGEDALAGTAFIDVGANIGTSSISALLDCGFGSAVCCEPQDENYRILRANLALNDLENVETFRAAVSNRVGRTELFTTLGSHGFIAPDAEWIEWKREARAARMREDPTLELGPPVASEAELVTVDWLVESGAIDSDRAGMLWIDAEGHEGQILDGAGSLTERGIPIVFEFDPGVLVRRGDIGLVFEVAEGCYTHFIDLRRHERGEERFQLQPVEELRTLAEQILDPDGPRYQAFSDLFLLRLDASQADAAANLPTLMRQSQGKRAKRPGWPAAASS